MALCDHTTIILSVQSSRAVGTAIYGHWSVPLFQPEALITNTIYDSASAFTVTGPGRLCGGGKTPCSRMRGVFRGGGGGGVHLKYMAAEAIIYPCTVDCAKFVPRVWMEEAFHEDARVYNMSGAVTNRA